ncbi:site-specific tyrosine recombinase XerC [Planctomycetes bacterium Pan216]|uniref:Site-specific tyrosine recombinase XerC n=1 Tax=Kolteria novifilia TaxID=2527975 RepID=A0A518B5A6_9BACT|nr:site-specific tyrosine recombinase XerC [Planctomycetes bacterium Pan216]
MRRRRRFDRITLRCQKTKGKNHAPSGSDHGRSWRLGYSPRGSWDEAFDLIESIYAPPLAAIATLRKHRQVRGLLESVASSPGKLTVPAIAKLAKQLAERRDHSTVNTLLAFARTQCGLFTAQGWLEPNPFELRSFFLRESEPSVSHLVHADVIRLLDQADREFQTAPTERKRWEASRLRCLLYVVAYTGLRAEEALHLRVGDLDPDHRILWVADDHHRTKTAGSVAPVPLPAIAVEVLLEHLRVNDGRSFLFGLKSADKPWSQQNAKHGYRASDRLKQLGERAGVAGVTLLRLRHTCATHAESLWGLSRGQIQSILRHDSPRTQRHYRHADACNLAKLVEHVNYRAN